MHAGTFQFDVVVDKIIIPHFFRVYDVGFMAPDKVRRQLDDLFDSHIEQLYVRDPEGIYHALSLDSLLYVHSEGRYLHYFTGEYEVRSRT